ncbi:molybdenum cofactor guanylyltransferase [Haloplanus salinus]|jgi:molybdopterin-guanine dinucleotide biosynthesis protein A|uniref:Probable molybdenum cofactor guanylyltransferase n=1 Tax=Haloplanus salinus TaxID=1126245 RepID=A0A368N9C6_9EURY|nr:molybdenum cofactor guanylyltransferase [Haloplanus salinus]RCU46750.1 molybdenum cofactor guanylyltransferase [Haloplanus salinus]
MPERTAVVLAGGRSTRFGDEDKAVADLAGRPMIRRVVDRLTPVVDAVVVNCRAAQRGAIATALDDVAVTVSFAEDDYPDEGPMAGMATGLRAVEGEYAFVVACDMPFVDSGFVGYLFDRAAGHDAAVPRPEQWFETTHAVYRAAAMAEACEAALAEGEERIVAPLFDLEFVVVDADEVRDHGTPHTFENCNTPEDFVDAARRLEEGS